MSTNRSRRIDRDTAEHLLGGAVGGPPAGQDASLTGPDGGPGAVARVLAAAAAPATVDELAGEEHALAAFREARLASDPVVTAPVRRRSMATATLARAFSTKAVAVVLGATALCGVAVAAGTGNLPSPLGGPAEPEHMLATGGGSASGHPSGTPPRSAAPAGASPRPSGTGPSGAPQQVAPSTAPTPGAPSAGVDGRGARQVPPALVPLCRGFADRTGKGERSRQLLTDPLYAPLVAAAGGAEKVAEYCADGAGKQGDDDHQGAAPQPRDPGRAVPSPGAGKGGNDNTNGNDNANGKGKGGTDAGTNGGDAAKQPGRAGGTASTVPAVPVVPDARPSPVKPDRPEDDQSGRR
ncbi:hypothetical protein [Kitasatospora sp. NPDC051705]|uniref:hypothetical protein n=1 Tax=Kitasatospora sp. NPDC051705 TaxID=3364057 RepID=UPI003791CA07